MPPANYLPGQAYQVRHDGVWLFICRVNISWCIHPTSLFELCRDKKDGIFFAMLFTLWENRRTEETYHAFR